MKAIVRQVRISPKKANLVAGLVRGKAVEEALDLLKYLPKKAAAILYKAVDSAAANAENNFGQDKSKLVIKTLLITKGATYKRWIPASRGRAAPLLKRTSHVRVELEVEASQVVKDKGEAKKAPEKAEEVVKEKKTEKKESVTQKKTSASKAATDASADKKNKK